MELQTKTNILFVLAIFAPWRETERKNGLPTAWDPAAAGLPGDEIKFLRAEDEGRTRCLQLGKLSLYQVSYFRE
jgi:hypothetical protein